MSYFDRIKDDPELVEQWRKSGFEIGVGRHTKCDRCLQHKRGCIWVSLRKDAMGQAILCPECRASWRKTGIAFINVDQDFPDVT